MKILILLISMVAAIYSYGQSSKLPRVKLTEVQWHGTGCFKIEMPMGTVYFEKDQGVSGFKSFIDNEGNDWIASYLEPGPNGDFRGFPNSIGNFGHAGRDSGSVTKIVNGVTEGELVILESTNGKFTFQYWFMADRVAIKVLKAKGDYCFLFEGVVGGTADAEDYFVTADGKKHLPSGAFNDFTPEWFYLADPKAKNVLFMAKTPNDDAPNENHRQIRKGNLHNMDLYSFGRTGKEHDYKVFGMNGTEHICVIGFTSANQPHNQMAAMIEAFLEKPFTPGVRAERKWSSSILKHEDGWYGSEEAISIANNVIQYQSPQGGWPKSTDLARAPLTPGDIPAAGSGRANTFDNDATTVPMQFLARVIHATKDEAFERAFNKGLVYIFNAQYTNGGWPQFWPLRGDKYYSRVTFNDGAMMQIMALLKDVVDREETYEFVSEKHRSMAKKAMDLGIDFILRSQVKQNGIPTVWCAQHDENTLKPAWARAYEPPSLSGSESVGILRFLMSLQNPSETVINAIENGIAWLKKAAIKGVSLVEIKNEDGRTDRKLVADEAAPLLWARFYELDTNRPLYLDRDSKFRYDFAEIGYERRSGYAYNGYWPASLLNKEYARWRAKQFISEDVNARFKIIEAEQGKFTGSIDRHSCWHNVMLTDATHTTHSGRGLVDTRNEIGSYIEVEYHSKWSGPHKITARYTHIKPDLRPGKLIVDGKEVAQLNMKQSEALPAWKTDSAIINLKEGQHTIRLSAIKEGGLPNMDYIKIAEMRENRKSRLPRIVVLEAEDGKFTGKEDHHSCWNFIAQTQADHSGFTGEGYVDTINEVGSYIAVTFNAKEAGIAELGIRYVHGKADTRNAAIEVNGEIVNPSLAFTPTGAWTAWTTISLPISLKKGANHIKLIASGSEGLANIDHFALSKVKGRSRK